MPLQFCALGVTMSWDDGFPGARASRPHNEGFPGARASRPHDDGFPGARASRPHDDGFPGARASRPHDDGFPGARASRPHQAWHSLGHLPHLDQPGTEPWLSFGLADGVPADRVAACSIALKLGGGQRNRMRAGRPRSQAMPSRRCGGGELAGDFSRASPGSPCRRHEAAASQLSPKPQRCYGIGFSNGLFPNASPGVPKSRECGVRT